MNRPRIISLVLVAVSLVAAAVGFTFLVTSSGKDERASKGPQDYLKDADFYFAEGDYQQSLYLYNKALEIEEDNVDALRGAAKTYDVLGYAEDAMSAYTDLVELDEDAVEDWIVLIRLKAAAGDLDEAKSMTEDLMESHDDAGLQALYDQMHPAAPVFNLSSGSYDAYQLLELEQSGSSMSVYYTLDGSDPTTDSDMFTTDGIVISEPVTTLKACAVSNMGYSSDITELNFQITVPVQAVPVELYSPVGYAVREIYPSKNWGDDIYNYEIAQLRTFYLIGNSTGTQSAVEMSFDEAGYKYYDSYYTGRGRDGIGGLEYAVFLKTAVICAQDDLSLAPLRNLAYLENLSLLQDNLTDVSDLAGLTGLKRLALGWNQIGDVTPLANMVDLNSLGLWNNQIGDVSALGQLTGLTYFDIANNHVADISVVKNMPRLTTFWCNNNQVSDLSPLDACTKLRTLMQGDNPISTPGYWTQNAASLSQTDIQ